MEISQNFVAFSEYMNLKGYISWNDILIFVVWNLIVSRIVSWTICIPFPIHTIQMKICTLLILLTFTNWFLLWCVCFVQNLLLNKGKHKVPEKVHLWKSPQCNDLFGKTVFLLLFFLLRLISKSCHLWQNCLNFNQDIACISISRRFCAAFTYSIGVT